LLFISNIDGHKSRLSRRPSSQCTVIGISVFDGIQRCAFHRDLYRRNWSWTKNRLALTWPIWENFASRTLTTRVHTWIVRKSGESTSSVLRWTTSCSSSRRRWWSLALSMAATSAYPIRPAMSPVGRASFQATGIFPSLMLWWVFGVVMC